MQDTAVGDFPSDDGYADMPGDAFAGDYPFASDTGHIAMDGGQDFGFPDPDQSEVRLASGILGFLEALLDPNADGFPHNELSPELARILLKSKPHKMHTDMSGATMFAVKTDTTQTGPAAQRIVWERPSRRRVIITNYGPGSLFISHSGGNLINSNTGFGPTNESVAIPPPSGGQNFSRELRTTAEIWAASNNGNNTVFDVVDEFDEE